MKRYFHFFSFLFLIGFSSLFFLTWLSKAQQSPPMPVTITLNTGTRAIINTWADARYWKLETVGFLRDKNAEMDRLVSDLKIIEYGIQDKKTELEDAAINGLGAIYDGSNGSSLASIILSLRKRKQLWEIKREKIVKLADIAALQPTVNAFAGDRDKVYAKFLEWWHYIHPSGSGGDPPGKGPNPVTVDVPSPLTLECKNGCGKEYSSDYYGYASLAFYAEHYHQEICNIPHRSGATPYVYYRCSGFGDGYNYFTECPLRVLHKKKCKYNSQCNGWYNSGWFNANHTTPCNEPVKKKLSNRKGICPGNYYHCVSQTSADCWNASNHLEDDSTAMHPCNTHETWQSGDHSATSCGSSGHYVCDGLTHQEARCTYAKTNGDQCTYTYWQCHNAWSTIPNHPHTFPEPTPSPEPEPEPQTETSASCRYCKQDVSTRDAHKATCSYGHEYWTCKSGATENHTVFYTCKRKGCGVSATQCGQGTCTSDWGTKDRHWLK